VSFLNLLPRTRLLILLLLPTAVFSVQAGEEQQDHRWLQVETDHFVVIYQQAWQEAAREVLRVADRVYRDTTSYMIYRPRERIPVVLYGGTARANGFFSPYPPHIALFVSSPAGPWIGARTESWMETVFIHELIHYLHLTRPIGFFGSPSRVFGPLLAATGTLFMPGWAVEGITVHGESQLAPGGRGDNPFFEMQAIAPVLEGRMYSYDQAGSPSPYAPRGRIYTGGYLMVDYLLQQHGKRTFIELNRSFQRAPFLGMRRAVRGTTGTRAPDLFAEMVAELERRYAWRHELPSGMMVSPEGPGDWFLPVPTERGLIAWGREFDRGPGIYLYRPGITDDLAETPPSGTWRLLAPVDVAEEWSWTVDRTGTLAIVSIIGPVSGSSGPAPATGESYSDLYLLELAEDSVGPGVNDAPREFRDNFRPVPSRRLTRGHRLFHPAISSATASQLVAVERRGSYSRLVEVDLETGSVAPIWEPEGVTLGATSFSPDGRLLALTVNERGRQGVAILDTRTWTVLGSFLATGGEPGRNEFTGNGFTGSEYTGGKYTGGEPGESGSSKTETAGGGVPALYFPRFVETHHDDKDREEPTLELWYGGDWEGELALYRSVFDREQNVLGAPQLILRDRVAAWGGIPAPIRASSDAGAAGSGTAGSGTAGSGTAGSGTAGSGAAGIPVIYGSYTADGFAIKRGIARPASSGASSGASSRAFSRAFSPPAPAASSAASQAPSSAPGFETDPRPYRDLPRPVLWLPQLSLRSGGEGEDQLDLGIFAMAASTLGRHTVNLSLLYNPDVHQPSGVLDYTFAPGSTRWNFSASQQYQVTGEPLYTEQTTTLALTASRVLWYDQHAGYYRALAGAAGIDYQVTAGTPGETDFLTGLDTEETGFTSEVEALMRLRLVRGNTGAVRDFFGPTGRDLTLEVQAAPPVPDNDKARVETTTGATVRVQPLRHYPGMIGAIQLAPTGYIAGSTAGTALDRLPYRSGGFADRRTAGSEAIPSFRTEAEMAWLGRLELRIPLGIHDAAWRGIATTGSGLMFYLEQGGAVTGGFLSGGTALLADGTRVDAPSTGGDTPRLVPTASTVAGAEFTMNLFFNMIPLRATAGVAMRFPHPESPVDRDWLFYLRLGGPVAEVIADRRSSHRGNDFSANPRRRPISP
jgi:hypothetical protein